MDIFEKIDFLCQKRGISRKKMCSDIGMPYNTMNSMLKKHDVQQVDVGHMKNMGKYFGVTLDYLLDDSIQNPNLGNENVVLKDKKDIYFIQKIHKLTRENRIRIETVLDEYLKHQGEFYEGD
jgi:transcriptional regulator with XRE-family HTH domain